MYSNYAGYIILIPADIFKNTSKGIFHVYRWTETVPWAESVPWAETVPWSEPDLSWLFWTAAQKELLFRSGVSSATCQYLCLRQPANTYVFGNLPIPMSSATYAYKIQNPNSSLHRAHFLHNIQTKRVWFGEHCVFLRSVRLTVHETGRSRE